MKKESKQKNNYTIEGFKIAIKYFFLSSIWILFSDSIVFFLFMDSPEMIKKIQSQKGVFFVFMSSLFIYILIKRSIERINVLNRDLYNSQLNHEKDLKYFGTVDKATGLPNRLYLETLFNNLKNEKEYRPLALIFIDIDNFSKINDIIGHAHGDDVLKEISLRFKNVIKEKDIISRITGDEFSIILTDFNSVEDVENVVIELRETLRTPIEVETEEFFISATIGISLSPRDGSDFCDLLKKSNIAMRYSKMNDEMGFSFYNNTMDKNVVEKIAILSDIRKGLTNNEFQLHYQIIKDLKHDKIYAVESLLRWYHPVKGYIPPLDFIPIAEKTNLILELRDFTVNEALRQKKEWRDKGIDIPIIGVNISLKSFCSNNLVHDVEEKMRIYDIKRGELALELTESGFIEDMNNLSSNIHKLRELGVRVSLDDFGTGYSSLSRLRALPIDSLKIDKEFIDNIYDDIISEAMVKGSINLANTMNVGIIAEGIEKQEQIDKLLELGCNLGQGYYIAKPMPADKLEEFIYKLDN